ncbi:MAG TPA: hypothetical protein VIN93_07235 [Bryobacteraceae bacterium]
MFREWKTFETPFYICSERRACLFGAIFLAVLMAQAAHAEECSIAKTNKDCTLTIDRKNPLAPPTIQMYPGHKLTVQVESPYYFEHYFLDYSSGQSTLEPDIASSIVNGLLTPLQKGAEFRSHFERPAPPGPPPDCSAANIVANTPKNSAGIIEADPLYTACFLQFANSAKSLYLQLEPALAPDSRSAEAALLPATNQDIDTALRGLTGQIQNVYAEEFQLSASVATAGKIDAKKLSADALTRIEALSALAALADAVAKDLFAYRARILDLPAVNNRQVSCETPDKPPADRKVGDKTCVSLGAIKDPNSANAKMITRQVTYAVDALNLVQNSQVGIPDPTKKKTIASITIVYGDTRWEASAGTFFSTLPVRSFSVSSVFANGVVTDKQIGESVVHPTIVPFAAANVRLSDDLRWTKWRSAVYWTFAVGVNPNTVSADFASGPSLSWRGLMFSALWHYGHDVRLTQGLYKGESLGASFSGTATTETFWRSSFAIGIAVRVPSLTGR